MNGLFQASRSRACGYRNEANFIARLCTESRRAKAWQGNNCEKAEFTGCK
ncbi:hypothetical protein J7J47_09440 [Halomonas sp. ISL-60]|nr:hypothetical protein [Halomonas sp. ISL-60]MBT2803363.1 hypothetical protein [Halomonas sp. ISL-56]